MEYLNKTVIYFAFQIGDIIPGHGGIMDRFDCQFLMATFVNVYIHSFIRTASPQKLLQHVSRFFMDSKTFLVIDVEEGVLGGQTPPET